MVELIGFGELVIAGCVCVALVSDKEVVRREKTHIVAVTSEGWPKDLAAVNCLASVQQTELDLFVEREHK